MDVRFRLGIVRRKHKDNQFCDMLFHWICDRLPVIWQDSPWLIVRHGEQTTGNKNISFSWFNPHSLQCHRSSGPLLNQPGHR